ncbi:hypothetical protein CL614_06485 [archaeon]|nr:hypothetical protein [archaeon]|tara:strand:- start:76 stop:501 length:426 start_codon:yes stop_codon:yes gene_type:complete
MPVVGINFTEINAKVNDAKLEKAEISVSSAPKITNLIKKDINMGSLKSVLEMDFEFVVKYDPNVGEILLKGKILFNNNNIDKIVSMWKDKKELDGNIAVEIMNAVFRQSLTKAVVISGDLRLPPPIRFPMVQTGPEESPKK